MQPTVMIFEAQFQEHVLPFDIEEHQPLDIDQHRTAGLVDQHVVGSQLTVD